MKKNKISLNAEGPILPGTVYMSRIKCGKKNCKCVESKQDRHIIYQWSGVIDKKNTKLDP